MKVLMTADAIGGVWTYVLELARGFQSFNVEVHIACMGKELTEDQWEEVSKISNTTIHSSSYKLEWMQDPWEDILKAGKWLLKLQKDIKADVVHLNNFAHGTLNWDVPVIMVAHSCVLSWWKWVKGDNAPHEWNKYYETVKAGLQAADLVVGVSKSYLKEVEELYGPFKKENVIYNGLHPEDYYIKAKDKVIFGMGRVWDEGKNLKMLASLHGQMKWPVNIAGNQTTPGTDKEIVDEKEEVFLGQIDRGQVKEHLSKASIYVLPAKYEPFGLSALEAAFSGCALVLSDLPTLQEIWGESALFFDLNNKTSLEYKINALINDETLLREYQNKAFEKAKDYKRNHMAESYINAYNQLLKPKMRG